MRRDRRALLAALFVLNFSVLSLSFAAKIEPRGPGSTSGIPSPTPKIPETKETQKPSTDTQGEGRQGEKKTSKPKKKPGDTPDGPPHSGELDILAFQKLKKLWIDQKWGWNKSIEIHLKKFLDLSGYDYLTAVTFFLLLAVGVGGMALLISALGSPTAVAVGMSALLIKAVGILEEGKIPTVEGLLRTPISEIQSTYEKEIKVSLDRSRATKTDQSL